MLRAWHVVTANGGDQTVTAHHCDVIHGGILSFTTSLSETSGLILVRAFAATAWQDVTLVVDLPHLSSLPDEAILYHGHHRL